MQKKGRESSRSRPDADIMPLSSLRENIWPNSCWSHAVPPSDWLKEPPYCGAFSSPTGRY